MERSGIWARPEDPVVEKPRDVEFMNHLWDLGSLDPACGDRGEEFGDGLEFNPDPDLGVVRAVPVEGDVAGVEFGEDGDRGERWVGDQVFASYPAVD